MKKLLTILFINLIASYVGVVIVNAGFDYRNYIHEISLDKKKKLESEAREADAQYYHACLADTYPQQFFPSLLRQHEWQELASKHNFMPLGAQPNAKLSYCNEGYGFVKYTSDRYGFRNDDANWDSKVDILLIGDSYMAGACVPGDKHIAGIINKKTELNVITLGSGGNGPHHYFALTEKFVPAINPRYAVLAFYPNDNFEIENDNFFIRYSAKDEFDGYMSGSLAVNAAAFYGEAYSLIKKKEKEKKYSRKCNMQDDYYLEHNRIAEENKNLFSFSAFKNWLLYKKSAGELGELLSLQYSTEVFLSTYQTRASSREQELSNLVPDVTKLAIEAVFKRCVDDCVPVFLLLPNSEYWRADSRADQYLNGITEYISKQPDDVTSILLDGRDFISSDDLDSFAPTGPHYSIEAYQQLADALFGAITSYEAVQ